MDLGSHGTLMAVYFSECCWHLYMACVVELQGGFSCDLSAMTSSECPCYMVPCARN